MGQKSNPIGLRVAVNKDWRSKWYADKKEFPRLLEEDRKIRGLLKTDATMRDFFEGSSRPPCRKF